MHRLLALLAAAVCGHAGVIQGVVLEHVTGRAIARTVVRLDPVPAANGMTGKPLVTRAGRSGQFLFHPVAPGKYLLTAAGDGYFPAAFGQRLPTGRGTPIEVTWESKFFAELRLRHKGAIAGRVLDENGVGAGGVRVVAYRSRLPLRSVGSATSDDRGVFRIGGLEPGKYWVRSAGHRLEDGTGWLATFGPQGQETRDARIHPVTVDADTSYADVNPEPGTLFVLGGWITCDAPGVPVLVTLTSETVERHAQTGCNGGYRFPDLAPGYYEVFAELQNRAASGFSELLLQRSTESENISLQASPQVDIEVSGADVPVRLTGRRRSLSGSSPLLEIKGPRVTLAPGYWELRAQAPPGYSVQTITNVYGSRGRSKVESASDWFEVLIDPQRQARIRINVSSQAGQLAGQVIADGAPVPGAPVFLWPVDSSARRSLGGWLQLLSDTEGRFRFEGLPPGDYRALASFDVNEMDEEQADMSQAPVSRVEVSRATTVTLPLWTAPY